MAYSAAAADCPLRIGPLDEFARVREFFHQAAFDDATLCRVLGMGDMSDLGRVRWEDFKPDGIAAPLHWCIQIFIRGLPAAESESRAICGAEAFASFQSLGLLRAAKKDSTTVVCPVWVYPADGWVMISDRRDDPDGEPYTPPEDVVFPAIYAGTLRFLKLLPEVCEGSLRGVTHGPTYQLPTATTPRGEALDLCGGSGIGALHLSRTARAVATADLTARSTIFAEFNVRLNNVPVECLCGDLYAPVQGRQFDLISAHPPFVPTTGPNMVYRDGGDTGEEVTRRVVEGLPAHLRPGGTCVILCVARDTEDASFERRVREWLRPAADEFDVIFGLERVLTVAEVVESMRKRGQNIGDAEARQVFERLRALGTRQFVYGATVIRRLTEANAQEPFRIWMTPTAVAHDFERLLAWRRHCRRPGIEDWLAESRPGFAPQLLLTARHVVREGALVPAEFVFEIEEGFRAALRPDAWVVPLVARLTGDKSVAQVFEAARAADELPEGFKLEDFVGLVRGMIDRGFLEVDFVCAPTENG